MSPTKILAIRSNRLALGLVALFLLAAFSELRVHLLQRPKILGQAKETGRFVVERREFAKRGRILSADGKALAADGDTYELGVFFDKVPRSDAFFVDLANATGIAASEFAQLARDGKKSRFWQRSLSAAEAREIQQVKMAWRADGISLGRNQERRYPLEDAAASLVGAMRDGEPLLGLEKSRNTQLSGQDGLKVGMVDRRGAFLPMRLDERSHAKVDGKDVVTTLDSEIQLAAYEAVREAVKSNKAERGSAIVLDPKTGDLLALASFPSFNPNAMQAKSADPTSDFNLGVMGILEPGSTFKILTLAKAIDEGHVGVNDRIHCEGTHFLNKHWRVRCDLHGGTRAHGTIDAREAIAKSCNICASTWALQVGRERFLEFLDDCELFEKPKLGLPGEVAGSYNKNEYAKPLQLAQMGFGQSLSVTPVALASAFAPLGNDGLRMKPRLIKQIGERVFPPVAGEQVFKPETTREVLECMEAVMESEHGTGRSLRIPGYRIGGKTGTAQKIGSGGGYVSNFVGLLPVENPRVVILVMIDNPRGGRYYGASVAGPAFVSIARAAIQRLDLPKAKDALQASQ